MRVRSTSLQRPLQKIQRLSYGWWIAVAGMMNMAVTSGPTFQGTSAIFSAVESEFGWSRGLVSGVASFGRFGGALFGPLEGFLTDRLRPARMMWIGLTIGGIGLILLSRVQEPIGYYASFFMLSVGFSLGGFVPSITAVNEWLPHRRATGFSFIVGGASVGGLLVPALAWGITDFGWRTTIMWIGVLAIALGPVFFYIVGRRKPPPAPPPSPRRSAAARFSGVDFTAREALRTRAFWVVAITHTLANVSTSAISAHVILHLEDLGLTLATASTIVPIFAFVGFSFQIMGGLIGDRVEKRFAVSLLLLVQASAVVVLAFSANYGTAVAFAVLWGIGFGGRTPILHAMRGEFFGTKAFGTILGLSSVPMGIGMMISPFAVGYAFDVQATYQWSFLGLAAAAYAGAVLILFAAQPIHPSFRTAASEPAAPDPAEAS